jgi:hypothetical protein
MFFVGAIITHLHARWLSFAPVPHVLLAVDALAFGVIALEAP